MVQSEEGERAQQAVLKVETWSPGTWNQGVHKQMEQIDDSFSLSLSLFPALSKNH